MKIHVIGSAKEGKSTIATLIARTLNSYGLTVRIEDLDVQAPDELQQKRLQAITSKGLNVTVKVVNSIADSLEEDRKLDDLFRAIEYTGPESHSPRIVYEPCGCPDGSMCTVHTRRIRV